MADGLTEKQYQAISLLAEGMQKTQVAEVIGVTRQTIANWGKIPLFADELECAIYEVAKVQRDERISRAREVAGKALEKLLDRLKQEGDEISTKDLLSIYKDTVSTLAQESKTTIIPPQTRDEDGGGDDEPLGDLDDPGFREKLRRVLKEER